MVYSLLFKTRLHGPVALLSFCHDLNDIILEVAKFLFHFRYQKGEINPTFTKLSQIFGRLLPISWFFTRIYYYPLKCMYGMTIISMNLAIWLLSVGAWLVMALNIIWFIVSIVKYSPWSFLNFLLNFSGLCPTIWHLWLEESPNCLILVQLKVKQRTRINKFNYN